MINVPPVGFWGCEAGLDSSIGQGEQGVITQATARVVSAYEIL
ncbi:MAG TPA: hypothetical protein PLO16_09835 [Acidocella sp.]|nr:hypothetical protein [Acidocella sp.]